MMTFGEYIKSLRIEKGFSQRDLSQLSGVSNAEISRVETGARKKISPVTLKSLYKCLGVSYEELLQRAGYIEEIIDHGRYTEKLYRDKNGYLVDIVQRVKDTYLRDIKHANLNYTTISCELT
jgi:transcriptional regulator with XRE-family HTH domain